MNLRVTIDRANLNLLLRSQDTFKSFFHWNYNPETKPRNVQGMLALADQTDGCNISPKQFEQKYSLNLNQDLPTYPCG